MFDLGQLHPQLADLILGGRFPGRNGRELFDLFFDLADRLFKIEVIAHMAYKNIDSQGGNTNTYQELGATITEKWPLCLALLQRLQQSVRWG